MKNYTGILILPILAFLGISYLAAMREYSFAGGLLVFLIITTFTFGVGTLLRSLATVSTLISFALIGLALSDAFKFDQVRSHIQFTDIKILAEFVFNMDFSILAIYKIQILIGMVLFFVFTFVVINIWKVEKKIRGNTSYKRMYMIGVILLFVSIFSMVNLTKSTYIAAVKSQNLHSMMVSLSKIRLSVLLVNFIDNFGLSRQFERDIQRVNIPTFTDSQEQCNDCPDLIIVHLESVFDPKLTSSYQNEESLGEHIIHGYDGYFGFLKTNIWGGFSWVSEFEILCGINHKLYGPAGIYTHYNIAPYFKGCIPRHLLGLGYETTALYTSPRTFLNVGNAFDIYGIKRFLDSYDLDLPSNSKFVTDKMMINALLLELDKPSSNPRFYFMSTNTNHSPHGLNYAQPEHAGVYNTKRDADDQLADYINRLNITLDAIEVLKSKIDESEKPTAILFYGDHHPHFLKKYKTGIRYEIGFDPDYATIFAVVGNKAMSMKNNAQLESKNITLSIEAIFQNMLKFANVPLAKKQQLINNITEKCGGDQTRCSNSQKSLLRVINTQ